MIRRTPPMIRRTPRNPWRSRRVSDLAVIKSRKRSHEDRYPDAMRIALVSPYSWTYQGGVNRHVEALAEQFVARGDHVRVLAPWDPPDANQPTPAPLPSRAAGGSGLPGPAGPHARHRGERRRLQSLGLPRGPDLAPPRAARRQLRRRPRARAAGADRRLGRDGLPGRAGGRHLPRLLDQGLPQSLGDACSARAAASTSSPRASPSPRPPPGLAGAGSAASTRSSPTASTSRPPRTGPEDPERRAPPALRGPRRGAQGPPGAARRLPGARRARALPADDRRRGSRGDLPPRRRPGR